MNFYIIGGISAFVFIFVPVLICVMAVKRRRARERRFKASAQATLKAALDALAKAQESVSASRNSPDNAEIQDNAAKSLGDLKECIKTAKSAIDKMF